MVILSKICLVCTLWSIWCLQGFGAEKSLNLENVKHFQVAIEKGLYGSWRRGNQIYSFAQKADFYLLSQYEPHPKEADLAFGTLHNPLDLSERIPLAPNEPKRFLRGMAVLDPYLLFLDSGLRQFLIWNEKDKIWQRPADIVLDLVRPPADARGEAPLAEVTNLRKRILKDYKVHGLKPELIAGMALLPSSWKSDSQFLLLLRLPAAPLVTVRCEGRHYGQCVAQRACFVGGLSDKEIEGAAGLAVHPDRQEIWVGLPKSHQIKRFKASSCLSVKAFASIALDPELENLSNFGFDSEKNLWLTLSEPDRRRDSSLFRWDSSLLDQLL